MTKIEFVKKVEKVLRIKGFQTDVTLTLDGNINGIQINYEQLKTYRRCIEQTVEPGETLIRLIGTDIMKEYTVHEFFGSNVILIDSNGDKEEVSIERYIPEKWIKTESKCHFPKWW